MGRTSAVTKILLLAAFLAAVGVRVAYVAVLHPEYAKGPTTQPAGSASATRAALSDSERRHLYERDGLAGVIARNLVDSKFGSYSAWAPLSGQEPWAAGAPATAFLPPGYPVLLALIYAVAGTTNFWAVFIVQAVIGGLGSVFAFYLGRRVFRSTLVGWLAWLGTAASYFLVTATVMLNKPNAPVLAAALVTWSVLLIVSAADTASFWRVLVGGIVTGLAVQVVPPYLIVIPFACLWFLSYGSGGAAKRLGLCVVGLVFFLATVAPWTYRNYKAFGKLIPLESSCGYHAWLGNNPYANGSDRTDRGGSVERAALEALAPDRAAELPLLNEVKRYLTLAKEAWAWARSAENADRAVSLRLRSYAYFWTGRNAWVDHKLDYEHPITMPVTLLLFVLALVGVGAGKTFRQRNLAWMIYVVLLLYPLPYMMTHGTSQATYRLPLDPLLMVLAAYAVATLLTGGRVGRARPEDLEPEEQRSDDIPLARA